jgi:hypothetical protein
MKSVMGNLPMLSIKSSLTDNGVPGGNVTVYSNDGTTPIQTCNGIGECNFNQGTCTCPRYYGFSSTLGVRGDDDEEEEDEDEQDDDDHDDPQDHNDDDDVDG